MKTEAKGTLKERGNETAKADLKIGAKTAVCTRQNAWRVMSQETYKISSIHSERIRGYGPQAQNWW
jgi:hypothetical protein